MHARRAKIEPPNPSGLCQCGCGSIVNRAVTTKAEKGIVRGEYVRYVKGHQNHMRRGPLAWQWKGGRNIDSNGYARIHMPEHPAAVNGYVAEHRVVVEQVLGRPLRKGETVHHINENRADNQPDNLLVLASQRDHMKLHALLRRLGHDPPI